MKESSTSRLHEQVCNMCHKKTLAIEDIDRSVKHCVKVRFYCIECHSFYSEKFMVEDAGKDRFLVELYKWCRRLPDDLDINPEKVAILWEN